VPDDPVLAEPVPDVALELEPLPVDVLVSWLEPGSVAATAPVASTLATPTPAVTTASRFIPRRRSAVGGTGGGGGGEAGGVEDAGGVGGTGGPSGLLDIGAPCLPPAIRLATSSAVVLSRPASESAAESGEPPRARF
jgi:hypothetical protein